MGLFGKKEICSICNTQESSKKLVDGHICKNCIAKGDAFIPFSLKTMSVDKAKRAIAANELNTQRMHTFKPTKKIEKYISFDEANRFWTVPNTTIIFSYDDIISYELIEDGECITKGGLGSAIVGGALFGATGAIVGGITGSKKTKQEITELKIRIITRNEFRSEILINFLMTGSVKSGSFMYNCKKADAQNILTELTLITDSLKSQGNTATNTVSDADEILKYKKLFDEGIITQEEFEAKKKLLLGL